MIEIKKGDKLYMLDTTHLKYSKVLVEDYQSDDDLKDYIKFDCFNEYRSFHIPDERGIVCYYGGKVIFMTKQHLLDYLQNAIDIYECSVTAYEELYYKIKHAKK